MKTENIESAKLYDIEGIWIESTYHTSAEKRFGGFFLLDAKSFQQNGNLTRQINRR